MSPGGIAGALWYHRALRRTHAGITSIVIDAIRDFLDTYLRGSWTSIIDIGLVAIVIYWLFILIRGTRAVRIVIGLSILYLVYLGAILFDLDLLRRLMETAAVVGLFAVVVVFQPELRRALEQIGRIG